MLLTIVLWFWFHGWYYTIISGKNGWWSFGYTICCFCMDSIILFCEVELASFVSVVQAAVIKHIAINGAKLNLFFIFF